MMETYVAFEAWATAPAPAWLVIVAVVLVVQSIGGTRPIINRLDYMNGLLDEIREQLRGGGDLDFIVGLDDED